MTEKCKWIYRKSLLITSLRPSCGNYEDWYEEFFDIVKIKYCPYCGKEVIKTEIIKFPSEVQQ